MALFPRQGLGAALQEASPLLLGLSQGLLGGNYGGGLAMGVQGLQQKTQEREGNEIFQGLFTQPTLSTMNAQPQGRGLLGTPAVSGGVGYSGQPQSANAGSADRIRTGLINRGLPAHVADGFVMNFQDESGLNPGINERNPTVPGSRGGFGLAQWTGPRRRALEQAAQQRGVSPADVDLQLDFLMGELQGDESRAARSILAAEDAGTAAAAVARDFLRPAQEHLNRRVANYTGGGSMSTMGGGNVTAGPDLNRMYMALASGRLNPNQAAVVQGMIAQTQAQQQAQQQAIAQANDPLRQVQLATAYAQLDKLQRPEAPEAPAGFRERVLLAQEGGLVPGSPEYENFILNGNTSGGADGSQEQKIARLMELGYSREQAIRGLDANEIVTDPYNNTLAVNKIDGSVQVLSGPNGAPVASSGSMPAQTDPAAPQRPGPPTAPQGTMPADTTPPPQGMTFPDATNAFGLTGAGRGFANTVADVTGLPVPYPETQETQSDFRVLRESLLNDISKAYARQPPSWLLQDIKRLIPEVGSVLTGASGAQTDLQALRRSMAGELSAMENVLVQRNLTTTKRTEVEDNIFALQTALNKLDNALSAFPQSTITPPAPTGNGQNTTSTGVTWSIVE